MVIERIYEIQRIINQTRLFLANNQWVKADRELSVLHGFISDLGQEIKELQNGR